MIPESSHEQAAVEEVPITKNETENNTERKVKINQYEVIPLGRGVSRGKLNLSQFCTRRTQKNSALPIFNFLPKGYNKNKGRAKKLIISTALYDPH